MMSYTSHLHFCSLRHKMSHSLVVTLFFPYCPDVKELEDHGFVVSVLEQVEGALREYTLTSSSHYPSRFTHLLLCLSELRSLSTLAEDYLYCRHLIGEVPSNNLLNEMLHAKYSWT